MVHLRNIEWEGGNPGRSTKFVGAGQLLLSQTSGFTSTRACIATKQYTTVLSRTWATVIKTQQL